MIGLCKYLPKLTISSPDAHNRFDRHMDMETNVAAWFKPFKVEYGFTYAGPGKKGAYRA